MKQRPSRGRALFYTRDSGGEHEMTPGEYLRWARREAAKHGVAFRGTPEQITAMIRGGQFADGDVFLDYGVKGNQLARPGLDALIKTALEDRDTTHVMIPRRDRFARPDDPIDALKLENLLREGGLTLVFMERVVPPLAKGRRRDPGEMIVAMLDYNYAGEFRRELAQKMIFAQTTLAKAGFSVGGRAPYGFRRWLAKEDGTPVRLLADGESVRMAGHHVVWLPGPEESLAVIRRILRMLETMPASRVAAILTAEGVPPPDAGRRRTDRGVTHTTSGVWHQTTVVNIARNPLIAAVVAYGRRSMGDQLRFTPDGPRPLEESDYRSDGKPKVVANPAGVRIEATAKFPPLVDAARHQHLLQTLDERGRSQRGKPRSQDPRKNPLGGRVYDMECGWPMYRQPYNGAFRYLCGLYQQSHGARCRHHHVDGLPATRFLLNAIRQRVLAPALLSRLEQKLHRLAERERTEARTEDILESKQATLKEVRQKLKRAGENMALAENEPQYRAMAAVFEQLQREQESLQAEIDALGIDTGSEWDPDSEVAAALAQVHRLGELASDPSNLASIGELFRSLNAQLYLRFREVPWGKRKVNRVAGGVVTFGATPPPIPLYEGPTSRRRLHALTPPPDTESGSDLEESKPNGSDREGESLGNVNRGERI